MKMSWTCTCCGQIHHELPMSWGVAAPGPWLALPEAEREQRGELASDMCVIDGSMFFLLGCIQLPVVGQLESFQWLAWVSLSPESIDRVIDLWEVAKRAQEPPRFGWLSTWLPGYPDPTNIKCLVHFRDDRQRPLIELEPTDYPLAVEQRSGITLDRVKQIAWTMAPH